METVKLSSRSVPSGAPCAVVLGHFDGVHLGHRALIAALRRQNDANLPLGAVCFREPPALFLSDAPAPQLTTTEEKLRLLCAAGLDFAVLLDFAAVRDLPPAAFVCDVLIGQCGVKRAVCGFNYSFGARGAGTAADLVALMRQAGREATVLPAVTADGDTVSSTRIRALLEAGKPDAAARLLGHPYALSGTVRHGRGVGRDMSAPTANLDFPPHKLIPAHGVYAARAATDGDTFAAVCNIGARPTFGGGVVNCETHLLDCRADLYGKPLCVELLAYLRPERAFENEAALAAQIAADKEAAARYFASHTVRTTPRS